MRIEELDDKCTEGRLTPEKRNEYEEMILAENFGAILQMKACRLKVMQDAEPFFAL